MGDENCVGGHCVVVDVDGTRQCVAADGSQHPCNDDSECGGETCFKPDDSFLGTCGNGFDRSSCHLDADCKPGFSCLAVPYADDGLGGCSEGRDGSLCGKDADCRVGRCIDYSCSPGTLRSPCHLDGDCDSGFCLFGAFCGDGTLGSGCEHDDDCSSNRCAGNAALSECTSGAPGSHCLDAADCESGVCIPEPGMDPYSTFGTCS